VKKALTCTACGSALTGPLLVRSGKDPAVPAAEYVDGQPLTEKGTVLKSYEPLLLADWPEPEASGFVPQYWINPEDVSRTVRNTKNKTRLSGCCGPSGTDGLNQICRCGAEVGTLQNDCWTPHVFIPDPGHTSWLECPDQEET
jgi:hypothetical protein